MFKKDYKYYKSRCPPPKFNNVVNFNLSTDSFINEVIERQPFIESNRNKDTNLKYGLKQFEHWKMFEFRNKLGLIFIVNPFTKEGQQYWVEKCLQEYTKKPNRLNLDPFNELQPGEDWWEAAQLDNERGRRLLEKLRWATLGYHHNWDTKEYSDTSHDEFPVDLAELSRLVVSAIDGPASTTYKAEAAIVNFYHLDSTLSGHRDVSEPNMNSPLLSISFGQSALFLVGGETVDEPVTPMFLHSGDIVVMSGTARQCYHGVPRILSTEDKPWAGSGWEQTFCGKYLETSRINMNVRQVLPVGEVLVKR